MNKKKIVLSTIFTIFSITLFVIFLNYNKIKLFLIDFGNLHISEKQIKSYFEENKEDLQIIADYMLSHCIFYDESVDTMGINEEFQQGEMIEYVDIYKHKDGYYSCQIFNKITGRKISHFCEIIEPYHIDSEKEPYFEKLYNDGVVLAGASVKETKNKSVYVDFLVHGYAIYDAQHIIYFKDKEHDLNFLYGYKVVPLSKDGWYYLALGDAVDW